MLKGASRAAQSHDNSLWVRRYGRLLSRYTKSKLIKPTDYRSFKYNSTNELGVMTTSCVSCEHVLLLKHVQIHTAAAVSMLRFSTITHNAVIRTKRGES